jgi:hypothetical protein
MRSTTATGGYRILASLVGFGQVQPLPLHFHYCHGTHCVLAFNGLAAAQAKLQRAASKGR